MRHGKGIVFFTTLVLLCVVILICAGVSLMVERDTHIVKRIKYGMQAYFLAEAGIEEGLKEMTGAFTWTPSGYPKNLGGGTYSVTVTAYPGDPNRKLITSTGTARGVSRTISLQVFYNSPEAFSYSALGGGKLTIAGASVVSDTDPIVVHSNNDAATNAVTVGSVWPWSSGEVDGDVSACGGIKVYSNGTVTGSVIPNTSAVELPPFDDAFFQYYYNLANADGKVYTAGTVTFTSDPCTGANHIVYVNGQARLTGTWSMTGCIVATGKIIINKWSFGRITQHQYLNLPAFMSKGSDVEIYAPTDIEGMVYANGYITIDSIFGMFGPTTIYGSLYGKSWVDIKNITNLHYRKPNPPGISSDTGITVLSWSGG